MMTAERMVRGPCNFAHGVTSYPAKAHGMRTDRDNDRSSDFSAGVLHQKTENDHEYTCFDEVPQKTFAVWKKLSPLPTVFPLSLRKIFGGTTDKGVHF